MEHHLTTYITHDTPDQRWVSGTQENLEAIRSYHSGNTLQTDKRIADIPIGSHSRKRLQQQAEAIGSKWLSPDGTTVHTDYQRTHPSVRTNFGRQNLRTHPSTTKGNIDLLARHTEHPDEASFFGKWQKTLPVISMPRNGCMSFPMPAFQECQPS